LPAAGVILLAALRERQFLGSRKYPGSHICRNLSILVAEIQLGSVIRPGEPNFILLTTAMRTIQAFIESWEGEAPKTVIQGDVSKQPGVPDVATVPFDLSPDPWNLEMGFWQDLGDLPFLGVEPWDAVLVPGG
jgi:hypothetical protein